MYFNKSNSCPHGIMFHHFHDNKKHLKVQGSINKNQFYKIIKFVGRKNILDAKDFYLKKKEKKLKSSDVCFTFDDCLKSQIDLAVPILEEFNIKAFFFIYTNTFNETKNLFEVDRFFRNNCFKKINDFYFNFYEELYSHGQKKKINTYLKYNSKNIQKYKKKFPHYSVEDINYRFIRDNLMDNSFYKKIIINMMKKLKFDYASKAKKLSMTKNDIKKLISNNHMIGLHSHTHPTNIEKLDFKNQYNEYYINKKILISLCKNEIFCASYPSGKFNSDTKEILKKLNIDLCFLAKMGKKYKNNLMIPREDHANIIKKIK